MAEQAKTVNQTLVDALHECAEFIVMEATEGPLKEKTLNQAQAALRAANAPQECKWTMTMKNTDSGVYVTECGYATRISTPIKNGMACLFCGKTIRVEEMV